MAIRSTALLIGALSLGLSAIAQADPEIEVEMHKVTAEGGGAVIGTVTLKQHEHGVLLVPELEGLAAGLHGFHLHENGDCSPGVKDGKQTAAAAAGGHYDPENTDTHKGPFETGGHLGDLPALFVNNDGVAEQPELAPNPTLKDFVGRALMIHQGGDNYSDQPEPLGGGGERVACGVVKAE
ncbi:MAG TPA: superoxide dismutase [Cu-Zn] SodC [Marinobacter sp.]|nr:superoxide dismutase [Cu-Zn] SodC [Marinobacter sp.]